MPYAIINALFFSVYFYGQVIFWQAVGDSLVMDADATSLLRGKGVPTTDDSYKFIWNKVSLLKIISGWVLFSKWSTVLSF